MPRIRQAALIASTIVGSWLGMQAVHETGHVLGVWLTGGTVAKVVLHPLTISRTDVEDNPHPLAVVWAGPLIGVVAPALLWRAAALAQLQFAFVLRFFAGFCLIANGAYIGAGSISGIGDCGQMLEHGSSVWQLWLFGILTAPAGLWLWHGLGPCFGLGSAKGEVSAPATYAAVTACLALLAIAVLVDGH